LRFKLADEVQTAPPGALTFIPRRHTAHVAERGWGPVRILVIAAPARIERFFDRFAEFPDDASGPEAVPHDRD
jgi:hypothetical protein